MLSRQHGESMSSYVARRWAWRTALQGLDPELKIPDIILAEQTLTNCGLSDDQKLMVRTMLQGRITTDTVADQTKRWRFQPGSKGGRGYFSEDAVNVHGSDDWETGSQSLAGFTAILDDEPCGPEYHDASGYVAESTNDMVPDNEEDFLVMNFALLCENGLDPHNDEACALAAESLQLAFMLRGHGKGKGHGGFQPHRHFDISGCLFRSAKLA